MNIIRYYWFKEIVLILFLNWVNRYLLWVLLLLIIVKMVVNFYVYGLIFNFKEMERWLKMVYNVRLILICIGIEVINDFVGFLREIWFLSLSLRFFLECRF